MQELINIIEAAIRAHDTEVQLFPRITENEVYMAIRQVMRDNPDIFWFSHQWNYSQSDAIVRFRYTIDKEQGEKIKNQIEDVVKNDFKLGYIRTLPVKEQVMYVYKWVALYCNNNIHSAHNQTIYSVFVHRHSVCTGIAKAAQYLFGLLGIESRLVFGKLKNSEEDSRHCWLIVNIENKWYHLDPTFALPETEHLLLQCGEKPIQGEDNLFYNYFCVDTASIKYSRTIEGEDLLPICNDKIEYADLQSINVTLSRSGEQKGLGCILSDAGTAADIHLADNSDKHNLQRSVAKVSYCPRIICGTAVCCMSEGVVGQLLIGYIYGAIGGVVNTRMSSPNWRNAKVSDAKVYTSVFAPAEIAPKQHLMIQVYLHLPEETEKVKSLASEADKNAERRGYEPLEVPLKKGDNVEIELNVNGDSLLYNCRKSVIWQGSFVKRSFDFVVPADINVYELSNSVNIYVNGAIAGELIFLTSIVDSPRQLNTNVYARQTKKLFISYSHKDIALAEKIAKIHEALGIDVFFDKHRLKAGYIYSEEISKFIKAADTFVLCWSENAAKSDYVEKERQEALALAYPQSKPRERARLRIHPYNIEPHAAPPADMIEHYHFEEL